MEIGYEGLENMKYLTKKCGKWEKNIVHLKISIEDQCFKTCNLGKQKSMQDGSLFFV